MNISFEEWIEKLKKSNPYLDWEMMSEQTMSNLKTTYDDAIKIKEKDNSA